MKIELIVRLVALVCESPYAVGLDSLINQCGDCRVDDSGNYSGCVNLSDYRRDNRRDV
jgi:hypothetical protein